MRRQVILISASILFVVLITGANLGTASPANWPMYRNNLLHTGVAADVVPPPLNLKWKQTFGGPVDSSPAVVGSRLYVGSDDGNLYAIDTATGNVIWTFNDGGGTVGSPWDSSPTVATVGGQTVIFAGNDDASLYAVRDDGATPFELWEFPTTTGGGGPVNSSPAVTTIAGIQVVIFGSDDKSMYALVAATGALYPGWTTNPFAPGGGLFLTSPAILGQTIFIGDDAGTFYAVNLGNGVQLWTATTVLAAPIYSSPAVANVVVGGVPTDLVFFGADDNTLRAFPTTGAAAPLWTFIVGNVIDSSPAIATIPNPPLACTPGPTVAVFFGSDDGNLYAVRASDGTPCWTFPSTGAAPFRSSPTVSGEIVYAGSDDNNLYAVDINTGAWQWSYPATNFIGDPLTPPNPVVSGTTVYAGSKDNSLYAFSPALVTTTYTTTASSTTTSTTFTTTYTTTVSSATTETMTSTTSTVATSTIFTTTTVPPGGIPGFPIESILVGILGGLVGLTLLRRRRRA